MRRKPTPGLCTAESREAWSHLPAILSSHTCARPSSRVCVCACVWVCTPAGLQLCLRVCTCVTVHFRMPPEYVHEYTCVCTPVRKHEYTLMHVRVCIWVHRSLCACLPISVFLRG